jgi:Skp family chaperone for outer membrane proteins
MKKINQCTTTSLNRGHIERILFYLILCTSAVLFSTTAMSQDLDDFRDCSREKGIAAIPYSRIRSDAQRAEDAKKSAELEAKSKFGVKALTNNLKDVKEALEDEQKVLARAKKELEEAKRLHPAVIKTEEEAVKESEERMEDLEEKVKECYEEIDYGMDHWKQLAVARGKVYAQFDKAIRALRDSERDPEEHIGDKPSDPEELKEWEEKKKLLMGYIRSIRDHLEDGQEGHDKARKQAEESVSNLDRL